MLSDDELTDVAKNVLSASIVNDQDAMFEAVAPLWRPRGDAGDGYLLTCMMLHIVIDTIPRATCPSCGTNDCQEMEFGLALDDGAGNPDFSKGMAPVTSEFKETHPAETAYMKLLADEFNHVPVEQSMQVWHDAVMGGYAARVLWMAVRQAGAAVRQQMSMLQ